MTKKQQSPPLSDVGLEKQLIALAMRQAQKQLADGTASSQVVTHFLRLGSMRAEAEIKKMELETQLIGERIKSEQSGQQFTELLAEALSSLKGYSYRPPSYDDVDTY